MIAEDTTLLEGAVGFQVVGSKCKKVAFRNKEVYQLFKKAKEKYYRSDAVKMGVLTPVRDVCALGRIVWCTTQDK